MKSIIPILLSLLILISTSGFTVSIHYCPMSKKTTYSLTEAKSCCGKKGKVNNCCKNTQIKIQQIKDDFTPSSFLKIPTGELSDFIADYIKLYLLVGLKAQDPLIQANHSPPDLLVPRTILYRSILI